MFCFLLVFAIGSLADVLTVPRTFASISQALNASSSGDIIRVSAGTYTGPSNCDLLIADKQDLTLEAVGGIVTIDCQWRSRVLSIVGVRVAINGFALLNGQAPGTPRLWMNIRKDRLQKNRNLPAKRRRLATVIYEVTMRVVVLPDGTVERKFSSPSRAHSPRKKPFRNDERMAKVREYHIDSSTGGNLYSANSTIVISNSIISGGKALQGGGLGVLNSNVTMRQCNVTKNAIEISTDDILYGGGALFIGCPSVNIHDSSFSRNILQSSGSGNIWGGGALFLYCASVTFGGAKIEISENQIISGGIDNGIRGGGALFFSTSQIFIFSTFILVTGNSILNTAAGSGTSGAGLNFQISSSVEINGSIEISHNKISGFAALILGVGVRFNQCTRVLISGPILSVRNNSAESHSAAGCTLQGAFWATSFRQLSVTTSQIFIESNSIRSQGPGSQSGGGVYLSNIGNVTLAAETVSISNNSISCIVGSLTQTAAYSIPEVSGGTCAAETKIAATSGVVTDGNIGPYSINLNCLWTITPGGSKFNSLYGRFEIFFQRMSTEASSGCSFDYVSIFDGLTSLSPLIGRYCTYKGAIFCSKGECPMKIISTGSAFSVNFRTDGATAGEGFALQWNMTVSPGLSYGSMGIVPDLTLSPAFAVGGGMYAESSTISIFSTRGGGGGEKGRVGVFVENNFIDTPAVAAGGGITVMFQTVINFSEGSFFRRNSVKSSVAAGAAIAALEGSIVFLSGVEISMNFAAGVGACFEQVELGIVDCPVAYGGGVLSGYFSEIFISGGKLQFNLVTCAGTIVDGIMAECGAHGGAISQTHGGSVNFIGAECRNNSVDCSAERCVFGSGGCVHADSATLTITDNAILDQNVVLGTGGGGAIVCRGDAHLYNNGSIITANTAREGGGLWLSGSASSDINFASFISNSGISVAGAISITEDASLKIQNSKFNSNVAGARASVILAFSDNSKSSYIFSGCEVTLQGPENAGILVGNVTININNVLNCSWPGTILTTEYDRGGFFSLACVGCDKGSYSFEAGSSIMIPRRTCRTCPYGARCDGTSKKSNGLRSLPGFWGVLGSDGNVTFSICPGGFCCPIMESDCDYDHCEGGRTGRLCGRCPPGQGLQFFSEDCVAEADCTDAVWVSVVAPVASLIIAVIFLLTSKDMTSSSTLSVILYFYQVLPLVKSTPWEYTSAIFATVMQSVATASTTGGAGGGRGICILPGMTAYGKLGLTLLFQSIVFGAFAVAFSIHWVLHRHYLNLGWFRRMHPSRALYFPALARFGIITYTALVLTPLQMAQCVYVGGKFVWWWDGEVECYQPFQTGAMFAVAFLCLLPLLLIFVTYKWEDEANLNMWQIQVRQVFCVGFRNNRRYWLGVALYRRFLLVLAYTTITDLNWRCFTSTMLCLTFLGLHLHFEPWENDVSRRTETVGLAFLGVLSASCAPNLAKMQLGASESISRDEGLEYLQISLAATPLAFYVLRTARKYLRRLVLHSLTGNVTPPLEDVEIETLNEDWEGDVNINHEKAALC